MVSTGNPLLSFSVEEKNKNNYKYYSTNIKSNSFHNRFLYNVLKGKPGNAMNLSYKDLWQK